MKGSALHTIVYAAALGIACAGMLTAVAEVTRPYREANKAAEKNRHILGVLGVPFEPGASAAELIAVFEKNVRKVDRGGVEMYEYREGGAGAVRAVAVPLDGPGLWGPIRGFMALSPDLKTIRGITFYEQEETPGLGGEIAAPCTCGGRGDKSKCPAWFRHQFEDKAAGSPGGLRLRAGGGAAGAETVDSISGATMTSQKVLDIINGALSRLGGEGGR